MLILVHLPERRRSLEPMTMEPTTPRTPVFCLPE
jgi:hypothetical protein